MKYTHLCPFCEEGSAVEFEYSAKVKFGRRMVLVEGLKKTVCDFCGSESVPDAFHDVNLSLIRNAGDVCRGAVSAGMLRSLREDWELTQVEASKLFGAGKSSFAKWESGQAKMSTPAALLIQVAMNVPGVMSYLGGLAKMKVEQAVPVKNSPELRSDVFVGAYETVRFPEDSAANVLQFTHHKTHKIRRAINAADVLREEDWGGGYFSPNIYAPDALVPMEAAA